MHPEIKAETANPTGSKSGKLSRPKMAWTDEQILAAADIFIPRTQPPAGYAVALGLMASALVLVPDTGPLILFHVALAVLGGVLIIFLVKPVFFRPKTKEEGALTLTRATQPLLFEFIDRTCVAIGVRAPAVIEVDCEVNAHVAMRRGLVSVVGGDLVLRIGLPLVAAFSLQQFAGVLAHEFGHFNQLAGRNSSYLIRRLIGFFAKIVFHRDKMDAWLLRLKSRRTNGRQLLYFIVAGPIESVRGLLWLMLIGSELLTRRVLRHMEYDADLVAAHVAGADDFIRVSKLLAFLGIAWQQAHRDLAGAFDHLRLTDDLPRLIVTSAKQLVEHRTDILASLEKETTGWFDTHPCYSDRMRNVRETDAAALLACSEPAKRLFSNFEGLSKAATVSFYQAMLGEKMATVKLVPAAELAAETAGHRITMKALRRYFQDQVILSRPIIPRADADHPLEDVPAAVAQMRLARDAMVSSAAELGDLADRYCAAEINLRAANAKVELCSLFPGHPRIYPIRLQGLRDQSRNEQFVTSSRTRLAQFEQAAGERMTTAIRLLREERVLKRMAPPNQPKSENARPEFAGLLIGVLRELQPVMPTVVRLRQSVANLKMHLSAYNPKRPFPPLSKKIVGMSGDIARKLTRLKADLGTVPYPFAHGLNMDAVGDVVVQELPDATNPVECYVAAARVVGRFDSLMVRMIGSLSEWAERVETAIGFEALAEPPDREDSRDQARRAVERRNTRRYWWSYGARAAGGIAMVLGLIWLSISPPALSGWGDQSGVTYRPAAFTASATFEPARPQIRFAGTGWFMAPSNLSAIQQMQAMTASHPWTPPQMPAPRNWAAEPSNPGRPMWRPPQSPTPQPYVPQVPRFAPQPFVPGGYWHPGPGSGAMHTAGHK
jgi:hypothetical protein